MSRGLKTAAPIFVLVVVLLLVRRLEALSITKDEEEDDCQCAHSIAGGVYPSYECLP